MMSTRLEPRKSGFPGAYTSPVWFRWTVVQPDALEGGSSPSGKKGKQQLGGPLIGYWAKWGILY